MTGERVLGPGVERLIDPHHHLWDAQRFRYRGGTPSPPRYLLPDYLADAAATPLVRSVHLQAEIERELSIAETRWLQQLAERDGYPQGIVAWANPADPDLERTLAAHAEAPNLRGIRQLLNWDADPRRSQCDRPDYLTDPAWVAGYGRLRHYHLSFDLQVFPNQMADAARVAASHPDTPMIVNHTGMPRLDAANGWDDWRAGMRALAEQPNVSVKISGFGMFDSAWTADSIRPYVLSAIEFFGVERSMFASNFPVDRPARGFTEMFCAFAAIVADFSPSERQALFADNAQRIYRLPEP